MRQSTLHDNLYLTCSVGVTGQFGLKPQVRLWWDSTVAIDSPCIGQWLRMATAEAASFAGASQEEPARYRVSRSALSTSGRLWS